MRVQVGREAVIRGAEEAGILEKRESRPSTWFVNSHLPMKVLCAALLAIPNLPIRSDLFSYRTPGNESKPYILSGLGWFAVDLGQNHLGGDLADFEMRNCNRRQPIGLNR